MPPHGQTRSNVIAAARDLFARQGYSATGITQILAEAGAPKGSLYFHFPGGKEQLATEAVATGAGELGAVIDAVLAEVATPRAALEAIAELLAARLEHSDFHDGCPITTVALDAGDTPTVRDACRDGYDGWLASIAAYLRGQGVEAPVDEELALFVLSTLEGALVLARTRRDAAVVRGVADRTARVVELEMA